MHYVLGVDGGNTKTIALLARLDGTIVGSGRSPGADIYRGEDRSIAYLSQAVTAASFSVGCTDYESWDHRFFVSLEPAEIKKRD